MIRIVLKLLYKIRISQQLKVNYVDALGHHIVLTYLMAKRPLNKKNVEYF